LLLNRYGDSEAAAQYRWKVALAKAAAKDYQGAWQWAQPTDSQPKSILAPRAFDRQMGDPNGAAARW